MKADPSRRDRRRHGQLPREPTRGLIEGTTSGSGSAIRRNFPENQLGASLKAGIGVARRDSIAYFPENQLGASLKVAVDRDVHDDGGHFPENQLGASLKAALPRTVLPAAVELPREPTRGLIEGVRPVPQVSPPRNFPENQLGASLKVVSVGVLLGTETTSPRTNSGPH